MSGSKPPHALLLVVALAAAGPAFAESLDAGQAGLRGMQWPSAHRQAPPRKPVARLAISTTVATPVALASVFDPPAPPPTPVALASAPASPVVAGPAVWSAAPRRYTLHRAYGETPDPAPEVTPTFLDAPPVDLAAPPPPEPTARAARQAQTDAADPDRVSSDPDPQAR